MVNRDDFQRAADLITNSSNVLVTSHTRPDGDACGSVRAIYDSLLHLGKKAQIIFVSPLPQWYEFLFEEKVPILGNDITVEQLHADYYDQVDLVIIVDTNSYVQLPNFDEWLKETNKKVLVIDHHITGDGLGDMELIDTTAAAAGEIVFDLLKHASWPISSQVAEALFVALATDSGWFRFRNADGRIFRNAADLIDAGAVPSEIHKKMFQNFTFQRMKLMVRMLDSLELHFDGRVAVQCIMRKDFDDLRVTGRDTENLIDECQRIGHVEVAVLLVELSNGGYRCSLRSKGNADVRVVAQRYGGGGHAVASGVNLPGPLDKAKQMVFDVLAEQLK